MLERHRPVWFLASCSLGSAEWAGGSSLVDEVRLNAFQYPLGQTLVLHAFHQGLKVALDLDPAAKDGFDWVHRAEKKALPYAVGCLNSVGRVEFVEIIRVHQNLPLFDSTL